MLFRADDKLRDISRFYISKPSLFFQGCTEETPLLQHDEFLQGAKIVCQFEKGMVLSRAYEKWLIKIFRTKFYIAMGPGQEKLKMHGSPLQAGSLAEIEPGLPDAKFRLLDVFVVPN